MSPEGLLLPESRGPLLKVNTRRNTYGVTTTLPMTRLSRN